MHSQEPKDSMRYENADISSCLMGWTGDRLKEEELLYQMSEKSCGIFWCKKNTSPGGDSPQVWISPRELNELYDDSDRAIASLHYQK
jgi:hypothetical protein